MDTRKVTVLAIALVVICASLTICVSNLNQQGDDSNPEKDTTNDFLADVNDGDGFGMSFTLDHDQAYGLLRTALTDVDVRGLIDDEGFVEAVECIKSNPTILDLAIGEEALEFSADAKILFDVNVSTLNNGDRKVEGKLLAECQMYSKGVDSIGSQGYAMDGFEPDEGTWSSMYLTFKVTADVSMIVSEGMIESLSVFGDLSTGYVSGSNYVTSRVYSLNGSETVLTKAEDRTYSSMITMQFFSTLDLSGMDSLSELIDFLVNIDSTDSLTIGVDTIFTYSDESKYENYVGAHLKDHSKGYQTRYSDEITIPAGALALLLANYGISTDETSTLYKLFSELADKGVMYDTVKPLLDMAGISITVEEYAALEDLAKNHVLPDYSVMGPMLERANVPVTEEQYDCFIAVMGLIKGDTSYSNMRTILLLSGIDLTEDQYNVVRDILVNKELPDYEVFNGAFGSLIALTEEQYDALCALITDQTAPEYADVSFILNGLGLQITEEQYDFFVSLYNDVCEDPTYEHIKPILDMLGVPITKEQYDIIYNLYQHKDSISYEDVRPIFEMLGVPITEEQYDRLLELYADAQNGLTPEILSEFLELFGIDVNASQCALLFAFLQDHEIPEYDDIAPLLQMFGVNVPKEMYDHYRDKFIILSKGPSYFSIQAILEEAGLFVSEETYDDGMSFLASLRDGLADIKNNNFARYIDWADTSLNEDKKDDIRASMSAVSFPSKIEKFLDTDENYTISYQTYGRFMQITDINCSDSSWKLSSEFSGYTVVSKLIQNYHYEKDGMFYTISHSTYYGIDHTDEWYVVNIRGIISDDPTYTIPEEIEIDGKTYKVGVVRGMTTVGVETLIIDAAVTTYDISDITGPNRIVVNNVKAYYDNYTLDPNVYEFPNTVDGAVYNTSDGGSYAYIVGFTESMSSFTVPLTVEIGGKEYRVTGIQRNIFAGTYVGILDLSVNPTISIDPYIGVGFVKIDGNVYRPGSCYGLNISDMVCCDPHGALISTGGTLYGFKGDIGYYDISASPMTIRTVDLRCGHVDILDVSGSDIYTVRSYNIADIIILNNNCLTSGIYGAESVYWRGIEMHTASYYGIPDVTDSYCFVDDEGAIYVCETNTAYFTTNTPSLIGFMHDMDSYTLYGTVKIDGIDYSIGGCSINIGTDAAVSYLYAEYASGIYSLSGVANIILPKTGESFYNVKGTGSLVSVQNMNYDYNSLMSLINNAPNLDRITFVAGNNVPWNVVQIMAEAGVTLATYQSEVLFNEKDVVTDYDFSILDIAAVIGENVETIKFTGKIGSIRNISGSTIPSNLESVIFEQKVDNVCTNAFHDCLKLNNIEFRGGVGTVDQSMFVNCHDDLKVKIHGVVDEVPEYAYIDLSKVIFEDDVIILHVGQNGIGTYDAALVEKIYNADVGAFGSGSEPGWNTSETSDGVTFRLYIENRNVMAYVDGIIAGNIPSTVTFDSQQIDVGKVVIRSGSYFTDGHMVIPAGVEIAGCEVWDTVTDVTSDSDKVVVRSYCDDNGYKTIMRPNGDLLAIVGSETGGTYTIPFDLRCSANTLIGFLESKSISDLRVDGYNPLFRVDQTNGYSSLVSSGTLIYITGSSWLPYTLPESVRDISSRSVLGDRFVYTGSNRFYTSCTADGYNTLLRCGVLFRIVGSGDSYTIPRGMAIGNPYDFIDRSTSVSVDHGNNVYSVIDEGGVTILINAGTIISCTNVSCTGVYTIPAKVTGVDLSLFNDAGVETLIIGKDVRYVFGMITGDSQIEYVIIQGQIVDTMGQISICKVLDELYVAENEQSGTYQKTVDGIRLQYICGELVYAECTGGHSGDIIINVDEGTTRVDLRSIAVDAISLPTSVESYYGMSGIVICSSYYVDIDGINSHVYLVSAYGASSGSDYPSMEILSLDGSMATVRFTAKDHYLFGNESVIEEDICSDKVLTLNPEICIIRYHTNCEAVEQPDEQYNYGSYIYSLPSPNRAGYVFAGWYTDSEFTERYYAYGVIKSDIDLYAKWSEVVAVTIHYQDRDEIRYIERGGDLGMGQYDLFTDEECLNYHNGKAIIENMELYALERHNVTFSVGRSSTHAFTSKIAVNGPELTVIGNDSIVRNIYNKAKYSNFDILRWTVDGEDVNGTYIFTEDTVLCAIVMSHQFTVTFVTDETKGTISSDTFNGRMGEQVTFPEMDVADGYRFVGWVNGFRLVDESDYCISGDITLTAGFVRTDVKDVTITFNVDPEKGCIDTYSRTYAESGIVLTLPEVRTEGVTTFVGWQCDGKTIKAPFIIRDDMVLEAVFFIPETHKVTFRSDNRTVMSYIAYEGESVTLPEDPVKASTVKFEYSFDHWDGYTSGMKVKGDVTFTAVFKEELRSYTVTFGGVDHTYRYGDKISRADAPAVPAKASDLRYDYINGAWAGFPSVFTVTGDAVFEAKYDAIPIIYTVIFYSNAEGADQQSVLFIWQGEYGSSIRLPSEVPILDGSNMVFSEWSGLNSKILGDASYYPLFTEGTVTKNDDGSTTVVVEDGNTTTTTEYATDGSSEVTVSTESTDNGRTTSSSTTTKKDQSGTDTAIIEREKTSEEKGGVSTVIESVVETVLDENGNSMGSTEKVETKQESSEESYSKTAQSVKTSDGKTTSSSTVITIESKNSSVKTSAEIKTDGSKAGSVIKTEIASESKRDIKDSDITTAIDQLDKVSKEAVGTVDKTIQVTSASDDKMKAETVISAGSLSAVGSKDVSLSVKSEVGVISIDPSVAKNLSSKSTDATSGVTLSIAKTDNTTLSEAQQRVVKDHTVFQLNASVSGESVHELGGKATITVPYVLKDGENPAHITVFFVDDDGTIYKRVTTYDAATGTISFETDHFSYYVIAEEDNLGSADDGSSQQSSGSAAIWIIVGVAAALIVGLGAFFIIRRH